MHKLYRRGIVNVNYRLIVTHLIAIAEVYTLIRNCMYFLIYICSFTVPKPTITIMPYNLTFGAMVGSPQDIQCIVSTVNGVELSSVMISWMGPGGESITNDSRVTISPTISSGNNYTSSLQFTYLMEGDEGMYTCNVMILETFESNAREMILNGDYLYYVATYVCRIHTSTMDIYFIMYSC